ncbi:MAG: TIM barrel protein [Planctomycetes bacterium]|nr:TIM barrel protein [Planctomycetota bacterium]
MDEPFTFALSHGFEAFEWFSDKKTDSSGNSFGWAEQDLDAEARNAIRKAGSNLTMTVHAPWQANPLNEEGPALLLESVAFASDIGAVLVNLHLYAEDGPERYAERLAPVIAASGEAGLLLSLENTPQVSPDDVNEIFAAISALPIPTEHVGLCLDIGHANLCASTRNDYIGFLNRIAAEVRIIHLHLHENYGDADTHLPLFTGPAEKNDAGVVLLFDRLQARNVDAAAILEQWPNPPELLAQAADKIRRILHQPPLTAAAPVVPKPESENIAPQIPASPEPAPVSSPALRAEAGSLDEFETDLVRADGERKSWLRKLQWVQDCLTDPTFEITPDHLATLAIYLTFLNSGQITCSEEGGHYRPCHHAKAAAEIEAALEKVTSDDTAWLVRRIYPMLPAHGQAFRRSEPLTRIRDIAHRNDIPKELKLEIKHDLQNKLHRCAGPEDLETSRRILERITSADADSSPDFVEQFRIFHGELLEFFNATELSGRLEAITDETGADTRAAITKFLSTRHGTNPVVQLDSLSALRSCLCGEVTALAGKTDDVSAAHRSQLRISEIGLEDLAFALLSEAINNLPKTTHEFWSPFFALLRDALANTAQSGIAPDECHAVMQELEAWQNGFNAGDHFHLLRIKASLERTARVAQAYCDRVLDLLPRRAIRLGEALGVQRHAIDVFGEGVIRSNLVFQLAKLAEFGLETIRDQLGLSPWETVVPGTACGTVRKLEQLEDADGSTPLLALLDHAEGDEEIPSAVRGIMLAHPLPHLSHLGVRARQAGIPFVVCTERQTFAKLANHAGQHMQLTLGAETMDLSPASEPADELPAAPQAAIVIPDVTMASSAKLVTLSDATRETCGAKATGAGALLRLAETSNGLFAAPRGAVVPFGVMEWCLAQTPELKARIETLISKAEESVSPPDILEELRTSITEIQIPESLIQEIADTLPAGAKIAVRSSANGEDLEELSGAGLYDSVIDVDRDGISTAIRQVWGSLWTLRAYQSRRQAGVPQSAIRMAVLVQETIQPDISFIMHTVDPTTGNQNLACAELAVGFGEILASACVPGSPCRILCNRQTETVEVVRCADLSFALGPQGGKRRLTYSNEQISSTPSHIEKIGRELAQLAVFLETQLGRPQDIEGVYAGERLYIVQSRAQQGISVE